MKLEADFSAIWNIANQIGATRSNFLLDEQVQPIDPIDVRLSGEGIDVNPEDLQLRGGIFSFEGRQVVLYIPNHTNRDIDKALIDKSVRKKFHITFCSHLEKMKKNKQFEKYKATNNLSGDFHIFGKCKTNRSSKEGDVNLDVCMYCLQKLNYQGSSDRSVCRIVRDSFDIPEFFSTYSSFFPYLPSGIGGDPNKADYTSDWPTVSANYRASRNYTCENCYVNLNSNKNLLHTHHIDTISGNNRPENLQALCIDCHRKEHGHMYVRHSDMQIISHLRREQGLTEKQWHKVLLLADSALNGVLRKLQRKGYKPPEIGYPLVNDHGDIVAIADVAWPEKKLAITIEKSEQAIGSWKTVQAEDLL
ncbi:HNH endonuclease [Endozoicomonas ascidiicola]|uniref:HNH endonuclease n=1 Tax=Endozoicomonas ascidiicola TaxID=1698521 RepID=UPI0008379BBA|nr:HNH endonuclease signature motif containing protein [Endozoicomonas ascidiicola]